MKTYASIGFQANRFVRNFITTFLNGPVSLISYRITLLSLAQAARRLSCTGLKVTLCRLSTPHLNVRTGSLRVSSHSWQTSPQVANMGSLRWWDIAVTTVLLRMVLMGESSSVSFVFQVFIVLSSPMVMKSLPWESKVEPRTTPIHKAVIYIFHFQKRRSLRLLTHIEKIVTYCMIGKVLGFTQSIKVK